MICPRYNACINTGAFISFVYGTMHTVDIQMALCYCWCAKFLNIITYRATFFSILIELYCFYLLLISVLCRKKIMFVIVSQSLCTYLLFTCPDKFFRGFNNSVHVTKAQIHAWLEQIQKFKDLILFFKTSENELNYTTKQIDNEIAFNE